MTEIPDTGSPSEPKPQRQVSLALTLFAANTETKPLSVESYVLEDRLVPPPSCDVSDSNCACT